MYIAHQQSVATLKEHIVAAKTESTPGAAVSRKPNCRGYMPADVLFGSLRPTVVAVVAVCAAPAVVTAASSFRSSALHASAALLLSRG